MRKLVLNIILLFITIHSIYSQDKVVDKDLFRKVSLTMISDTTSLMVYTSLFQLYKLDTKMNSLVREFSCFSDVYIQLYNRGVPFVRLIKKNSIENSFEELLKKSNKTNKKWIHRKYNQIVCNLSNYNTDDDIGSTGEQMDYFFKFLEHYLILPESK